MQTFDSLIFRFLFVIVRGFGLGTVRSFIDIGLVISLPTKTKSNNKNSFKLRLVSDRYVGYD